MLANGDFVVTEVTTPTPIHATNHQEMDGTKLHRFKNGQPSQESNVGGNMTDEMVMEQLVPQMPLGPCEVTFAYASNNHQSVHCVSIDGNVEIVCDRPIDLTHLERLTVI